MTRIWLQSLLPGVRRRRRGKSDSKILYLTFDDGPDPAVTPAVLDLLQQFEARATFFLIGQKALMHRALVADMAARGHLLGNHSFTHPRMTCLPMKEQLLEVTRTNAALESIDGMSSHPFRPPYGLASLALLSRLNSAGIRTEYWSIDSKDFRHDSDASISLLRGGSIEGGDVVLMHDDHDTVLDILRTCLQLWADAGFKHSTLAG